MHTLCISVLCISGQLRFQRSYLLIATTIAFSSLTGQEARGWSNYWNESATTESDFVLNYNAGVHSSSYQANVNLLIVRGYDVFHRRSRLIEALSSFQIARRATIHHFPPPLIIRLLRHGRSGFHGAGVTEKNESTHLLFLASNMPLLTAELLFLLFFPHHLAAGCGKNTRHQSDIIAFSLPR